MQEYDAEVSLSDCTEALLHELDLLAPFGPGDCVLLKASHFFGRFDLMADFLREYPFEA